MSDFNLHHWYVRTIQYYFNGDGYNIIVTTDVPSHLWLRETETPPRKHSIPSYRRGLAITGDIRFCFVLYSDNEQQEPGDTKIHTFVKINWPLCQTRWFYFIGQINAVDSPSESAILKIHRDDVFLYRRVEYPTNDCQRGTYRGNPYFGTNYGYNAAGWHDWRYTKLGCGMRFINVDLPLNSVLQHVYLQFRCHTTTSNTIVRTKIRGHLTPFSPTFTTMFDYDARVRTVSEVLFDDIEPWNILSDYWSPDIKDVINEIIQQPGWAPGFPVTLFWDDYDDRSDHGGGCARWASSYESSPSTAPLLRLHYKVT